MTIRKVADDLGVDPIYIAYLCEYHKIDWCYRAPIEETDYDYGLAKYIEIMPEEVEYIDWWLARGRYLTPKGEFSQKKKDHYDKLDALIEANGYCDSYKNNVLRSYFGEKRTYRW